MEINDERVAKAVEYLTATDEPAAEAKANVEWMKEKQKTVKSTLMMHLEGAITHRQMEAESMQEYIDVCREVRDAVKEYELLRNRRKSAELIFEQWRTISANRRKGTVM